MQILWKPLNLTGKRRIRLLNKMREGWLPYFMIWPRKLGTTVYGQIIWGWLTFAERKLVYRDAGFHGPNNRYVTETCYYEYRPTQPKK